MNSPTYNFVVDCDEKELQEYIYKVNIEAPSELVGRTDLEWCLQSYLILKKNTSLPLTCSNYLKENTINIIHSDQLLKFKGSPSHFILCIQADFPPRKWAHYHLVQNKNQLRKNCSCIVFWLQPGLIKRDISRRGVKRVAYAGQTFGNFAGTSETWNELLEKHNIEFVTIPKEQWHNLRSIDVLVGLRSFNKQLHDRKPPSKLINAWHAEIPFVGGYDSAFTQVGTDGEDYLRVHSADQAINAILRLKKDEELYRKLVENGRKKSHSFTTDTIVKAWEEVLTGPVVERYKTWKRHPTYEKSRFIIKQKLSLLEHQLKQVIKKLLK
jgi:hypothetical protein